MLDKEYLTFTAMTFLGIHTYDCKSFDSVDAVQISRSLLDEEEIEEQTSLSLDEKLLKP